MSATPFLVSGETMRRRINRTIETHAANELRAWKRRHLPHHIQRATLAFLIAGGVLWLVVAVFTLLAGFDL